MNLATHLHDLASEREVVLANIKHRVMGLIESAARYGAMHYDYEFPSFDVQMLDAVAEWLISEGLEVRVKGRTVQIIWQERKVLDMPLIERILRHVEAHRLEGDSQSVSKLTAIHSDSDIQSAIAGLQEKGYQIVFEPEIRVLTVKWEEV